MIWRPILDDERAHALLQDLTAAVLSAEPDGALDGTLALGEAGIALFLAYAQKEEAAGRWLDRAVEVLSERDLGPGLFDGVAGIGWAVAHVIASPQDEEDPCAPLDEALLDAALPDPDLVSGWTGVALYGLERAPRPIARQLLERAVAHAAEIADGGFSHDVGVAHGLAGIVGVLARAHHEGIPGTAELLARAVAGLLSLRHPGETSFPSSQFGWCYGDPGVAAVLLSAARVAGEPRWEREALAIARQAARQVPQATPVKDAGLCHGAAGVAHLFNRMHQATGDEILLGAARRWFARLLDLRRPGTGVAGFSYYRALTNEWLPRLDLLTGAAGIGLALLAALTPAVPAWDKVFLVS